MYFVFKHQTFHAEICLTELYTERMLKLLFAIGNILESVIPGQSTTLNLAHYKASDTMDPVGQGGTKCIPC